VARIIKKPGKDSYPISDPRFEETCIQCGHCVAACPTGALEHERLRLADCRPLPEDLRIDPDAARTLLISRRSIRNYRNTPVPRETIEEILDVARHAPSGGNRQNVRYLVCNDPARVQALSAMAVDSFRVSLEGGLLNPEMENRARRLIEGWERGLDPIMRRAPAFILAHSNTDLVPSQVNCVLAISYAEIMAHALGLGACQVGYFTGPANSYPPLRAELGLPEGHTAAGTLLLGYPRFKYQRVPPRNEAKFRWI